MSQVFILSQRRPTFVVYRPVRQAPMKWIQLVFIDVPFQVDKDETQENRMSQ